MVEDNNAVDGMTITQCADDGTDQDLGRTWAVESDRLAVAPLGLVMRRKGLIGERPDTGQFYWEAWDDVTATGVEHFAAGYEYTFDEAVSAISQTWTASPAVTKPYNGSGYTKSPTAWMRGK